MVADISMPMNVQTPDKIADDPAFKTPDPVLFASSQDTSVNLSPIISFFDKNLKSVKWGDNSDSCQVLELLAETSPRGLLSSLENFKADIKRQSESEE